MTQARALFRLNLSNPVFNALALLSMAVRTNAACSIAALRPVRALNPLLWLVQAVNRRHLFVIISAPLARLHGLLPVCTWVHQIPEISQDQLWTLLPGLDAGEHRFGNCCTQSSWAHGVAEFCCLDLMLVNADSAAAVPRVPGCRRW